MEPTYPINYRAGWIQPADEYIPEVIQSKPQWITTSRLPDYGPVVEDDHKPTNTINEPINIYQKMQFTRPFSQETNTTEFVNELIPFDLPKKQQKHEKHEKQSHISSLREPLHFKDTFDNQNVSKREWQQKKLKGITNISNLDSLIHDITDLWQDVNMVTSNFSEFDDEESIVENLTLLQSKLELLPEDNIRIDVEELNELRDLGVEIPQRVNRVEAVRKTIQRHIEKWESSVKKNI